MQYHLFVHVLVSMHVKVYQPCTMTGFLFQTQELNTEITQLLHYVKEGPLTALV